MRIVFEHPTASAGVPYMGNPTVAKNDKARF